MTETRAVAALLAHIARLEASLTGNPGMSYGTSDSIIDGIGYLKEAVEVIRKAEAGA